MSAAPLTPSATAARIWKLLRGIFGNELPAAIDLEVVRELLNQPAFGKGESLKKPIAFDAENFEGALVRNSDRHDEWGIFYKPRPKCPERERFTIAHEFGHYILHRHQQDIFECGDGDIETGDNNERHIETEADLFASTLLMPLDDYRALYHAYLLDPDLQDARARWPFVCIWDDHEITNDAWKNGAQNHQPSAEGDYDQRVAAGLRAVEPCRLPGRRRHARRQSPG